LNPLRILIATESLELWGAERTLVELLKHVDQRRFRITLLVQDESPLAEVVEELGFHCIRHRFARHPALQKHGGLANAGMAALAAETLSCLAGGLRLVPKVRRFDIVLSFSLWQAIEVLVASRITRRAFVLDLHETFAGNAGHKFIRAITRFSNAVIAPSHSILSRSGLSANSTKLKVIPRPVDTSAIEQRHFREHPRQQLTVGVFGQISPHKGVQDVVDAVASLQASTIRLLIVGGREEDKRSRYENQIRASVAHIGNGSSVIDRVPNVFGLMASCHLVVNASKHEAFGRGMVEAIAAGALPIAIGEAGPSEIIRDAAIGVIVPDSEVLASYLGDLLNGRQPMPRASEAAIESALRRYDPLNVASEYFDFLSTLLVAPKR